MQKKDTQKMSTVAKLSLAYNTYMRTHSTNITFYNKFCQKVNFYFNGFVIAEVG